MNFMIENIKCYHRSFPRSWVIDNKTCDQISYNKRLAMRLNELNDQAEVLEHLTPL